MTNCTQTVMNLMDTKYNLRRKERTEIMACRGWDIRGQIENQAVNVERVMDGTA
jgi:hypothetical protein